jgi:ABC-type uncharacterized transport system YnjBCD substrate-binding protein
MFRLIDAQKTVVTVLTENYPNAEIKTGQLFDEDEYDFNVKQVGSCIYVNANNHYFVDESDKKQILNRGVSKTSDRHLEVDRETYDSIWFKLTNN